MKTTPFRFAPPLLAALLLGACASATAGTAAVTPALESPRSEEGTASIPDMNFVRGEWLLADTNGRPFEGEALTRINFGPEYTVEAAHCRFATNDWFPASDMEVRIGGAFVLSSEKCRARTLGDRLARLASAAVFKADPVETRLEITIRGRPATLVPAVRFPHLASGARSIPPHPWAQQLAKVGQSNFDGPPLFAYALRATGLGGEGSADAADPIDPRRLAFAGLTAAQYRAAQTAGLLPRDDAPAQGLEQHFASAPIVVRARFEGMRAVDRGDGLALDYHYRVLEGWRGEKTRGEVLLVRMPAVTGKSASPVITPETGAEVVLLASRTGYLVRTLIDGNPPSLDTRVVQMTLPLMRIARGRLVEAVAGANVLGAASFAGTTVEEARALAAETDRRMKAIAPPRPVDRFGNLTLNRFFVTRIGDRVLADPTRSWIEYDIAADYGNRAGYGGVVAFFDGCTVTRRSGRHWVTSDVGCADAGAPLSQAAVAQAVQWIEDVNFPHVICTSSCPVDPEYTVPLAEGDVVMKAMLE